MKRILNYAVMVLAVMLMSAVAAAQNTSANSAAQAEDHFFPETGHTVPAIFYQYWQTHGGLKQQGYPITDAAMQKNAADGKEYLTRYFERARFEYHPEYKGTENEVLLGLLGVEVLKCSPIGSTGGANPKDAPGTSDLKFLARPSDTYIAAWCVQDFCPDATNLTGVTPDEEFAAATILYHHNDESSFDPQQILNFYTNKLTSDGWTALTARSPNPSTGDFRSSIFAPPPSLQDKVKRFALTVLGFHNEIVEFAVVRTTNSPPPPAQPDLSLFVGH